MNGLLPGPGGWYLTPEGAALHPDQKVAVIADVHLGYEWARAEGGDIVPAHSLDETLHLLESLLARLPIARLVVAGDLVESRRYCRRTLRDVAALTTWLTARSVRLESLAGNHDPPRRPPLPPRTEVDGWTIAHGDRPLNSPRTITGHLHPILRASGLSAPCFLVSPDAIVLPAFSPNAAGVPFGALRRDLDLTRATDPFRCLAAADGLLMDFGPVPDLLRALEGLAG